MVCLERFIPSAVGSGQGILRNCLPLLTASCGLLRMLPEQWHLTWKRLGSTRVREYGPEDNKMFTPGKNYGPHSLRRAQCLRRGAFWSFLEWEAHGYVYDNRRGEDEQVGVSGENASPLNLDITIFHWPECPSVRYFFA